MIGEDQTATGELDAIAIEVRRWQSETFGPAATRSGCFARLEHIRREIEEAQECAYMVDTYTARALPESADVWRHDLASELADVFILLLSAVDEAGSRPGTPTASTGLCPGSSHSAAHIRPTLTTAYILRGGRRPEPCRFGGTHDEHTRP